jgi:hypothetical protein
MCRSELVAPETPHSEKSVIGEECHIIAQSRRGPRGQREGQVKLHEYENLILLCRNDHKRVDDQRETFTEEYLTQLKSRHEAWVASALRDASSAREPENGQVFQVRMLSTGEEVVSIINGVQGYDFDQDPLRNQDEVALVATFMQSVKGWADI